MQAHSRHHKMVGIAAIQRLAECVKFWSASSYPTWPFYFILGRIMRYREICCSASGVVFWCVTFWRIGRLQCRYSSSYSVIFDVTTIHRKIGITRTKTTLCHRSDDLTPLTDRIFVKYQILQTEGLRVCGVLSSDFARGSVAKEVRTLRSFETSERHGVTFRKTCISSNTAVRTWNLTT
jgi:hypothetical protein